MSDFSCIRYEVDGPIATITIARPKALNALNAQTIEELDRAIDKATQDGVRGLMLTGEGEKAFVAGADIAAMKEMSEEQAQTFSQRGSNVFRKLELLPIPVVAAVNGFALGGGCELMLSCDFAIASNKARFGQPEVNLGIIAGFGGTQRLARKIPYGVAMELLMNGGMIDAAEAHRVGLVNRIVEPDQLLDEARKALKLILSRGPVAVAQTKAAVQRGLDGTLDDGLAEESRRFGVCFGTADAKEGIGAFLEKRKADFQGK